MRQVFLATFMSLLISVESLASEALPRVVSINLCADQLVMLLADPSQILALSRLSRDEAGSRLHKQAMQYPQVQPIAEDIVPLAPDVIVTGLGSLREHSDVYLFHIQREQSQLLYHALALLVHYQSHHTLEILHTALLLPLSM